MPFKKKTSRGLHLNPSQRAALETHRLVIPAISRKSIVMKSVKTYCRLCMNQAPKNQLVCLGDYHDLNYPSRTEQFKRNKILQTEMYVKMINILMPQFDHKIVDNSVMCHACSTRLQMASDFVEQCMTTQKYIKKYKEIYCRTDELVSMEEVVRKKSTLDIDASKIKRIKTVKVARATNTKLEKPAKNITSNKATFLEPEDVKIEIEEPIIEFKKEIVDMSEENLELSPTDKVKVEPVSSSEKSSLVFEDTLARAHTDLIIKSEETLVEMKHKSIPININTHSMEELPPVQFVQPMSLQLVQQMPLNYINLVNSSGNNIVCTNIGDSFSVDPTNISINASSTCNRMADNN